MNEKQKQAFKLHQELKKLDNAYFMPFEQWEIKRKIIRDRLLRL